MLTETTAIVKGLNRLIGENAPGVDVIMANLLESEFSFLHDSNSRFTKVVFVMPGIFDFIDPQLRKSWKEIPGAWDVDSK
jgi:hypothetical protein